MRAISHLKGIQAFEAAARHLSYVEAAHELNVTPAAIAQLVRSLETWLGLPLFRRSRTGTYRLALTDAAREALGPITRGFDQIDHAIRQLKASGSRKGITVTASPALATRWLIPHLERFSMLQPDVEIRLDVTDRVVDLERQEADIGIRCGLGHWPGTEAFKLMDETIIAVGSPALIDGDLNPDPTFKNARLWDSPEWIVRQVPIHDTSAFQQSVFPSWESWLQAADADLLFKSPGISINSTAAVIQAALRGQGVALVRRALVAHDLAEGRLVQCLAGSSMLFAWSYYCVISNGSQNNSSVKAFAEWLRAHWALAHAAPQISMQQTG